MLASVDQPGADRAVTVAGNPIRMTETPPSVDRRAPLLDEHREDLLGSSPTDAEDGERAEGDD